MSRYTPPKLSPGCWALIASGGTSIAIAAAEGVQDECRKLAQRTADIAARKAWLSITSTYRAGLEAALMERDFFRECVALQTERLRVLQAETAHLR